MSRKFADMPYGLPLQAGWQRAERFRSPRLPLATLAEPQAEPQAEPPHPSARGRAGRVSAGKAESLAGQGHVQVTEGGGTRSFQE